MILLKTTKSTTTATEKTSSNWNIIQEKVMLP